MPQVPPPGMTLPGLRALLAALGDEAHALVDEQYRVLNDEVLPALAHAGIRLMRRADLQRRSSAHGSPTISSAR